MYSAVDCVTEYSISSRGYVVITEHEHVRRLHCVSAVAVIQYCNYSTSILVMSTVMTYISVRFRQLGIRNACCYGLCVLHSYCLNSSNQRRRHFGSRNSWCDTCVAECSTGKQLKLQTAVFEQ